MVEGVGSETVEFSQTACGVARIRENRPTLLQHLGVEAHQPVAQTDVGLDVAEVAVRCAAQLVRRAVLMNQPGDLAWMAYEVGRELRGDDQIDRPAVALAQV